MVDTVFVLGSGGREFALAHKLYQEGHHVIAVPGNDGMERLGIAQTIPLPKNVKVDNKKSFGYISEVATQYNPSLIVVGPENPLAIGIVNYLNREGHLVFGPTQRASKIEASKCWSSEFMKRNGIRTPDFYNSASYQDALDYVKRRELPLVIKGDGLAQGKGVTVVRTFKDAQSNLYSKMVEGRLGGPKVNIQDYIDIAYELSAMAIVDVRRKNGHFTGDYRLLEYSMDHKQLLDDDKGPNTGGMGAVAPLPLSEEMRRKIRHDFIERTIEGLIKEQIEFTGCLYPALAVDKRGNIWTLEYNVRFADPETQVVIDMMESHLYDYLMAASVGELDRTPEIRWRNGYSVIVNIVSPGYPDSPKTGLPINGLNEKGQLAYRPDLTVVHAGTKFSEEANMWLTDGGRILGVRARGQTPPVAIQTVYSHIGMVYSEGSHYRGDIGRKAMMLLT